MHFKLRKRILMGKLFQFCTTTDMDRGAGVTFHWGCAIEASDALQTYLKEKQSNSAQVQNLFSSLADCNSKFESKL
ncbi:unnamed protein product [Clavelina lepadiformis]|uniref:Uncharacterized protein n=1 Tax=Clavelina lepadiformis TaxID=159417 RepID=A0ABP0F6L1_CLALP